MQRHSSSNSRICSFSEHQNHKRKNAFFTARLHQDHAKADEAPRSRASVVCRAQLMPLYVKLILPKPTQGHENIAICRAQLMPLLAERS
eukprot:6183381-Pleurochrysis_carterae.AAC.2